MTKPIINPPLPLKAVSSRYCYWLLRPFNSMAKNVTRDTERLQMMQSNNKELSSVVSQIQSNNKELSSAVSRIQSNNKELKSTASALESTASALESTASALESRNRELSSAVSRMQSQISRLKRNRQPPTPDHPNPPPLD
jgi:uncharacterized protein YukE